MITSAFAIVFSALSFTRPSLHLLVITRKYGFPVTVLLIQKCGSRLTVNPKKGTFISVAFVKGT